MRHVHIAAVAALFLAACRPPPAPIAPKHQGIRSTINITPKTDLEVGGGYDFDLLDPVEGSACVGPADIDVFYASIPGFEFSMGDELAQRAEGAALYDAMSKASGADTLLVTWVKTMNQEDKRCVTVHARGVRLKQAGVEPQRQVAPAAPTAPAS